MNSYSLQRTLESILRTREHELTCEEVARLLDRYVDQRDCGIGHGIIDGRRDALMRECEQCEHRLDNHHEYPVNRRSAARVDRERHECRIDRYFRLDSERGFRYPSHSQPRGNGYRRARLDHLWRCI